MKPWDPTKSNQNYTIKIDVGKPNHKAANGWDKYGQSCGGSRWFKGTMEIECTPTKAENGLWMEEKTKMEWLCPFCEGIGKMEWDYSIWPTGNPGYHHQCTRCKFRAAITGNTYPKVVENDGD